MTKNKANTGKVSRAGKKGAQRGGQSAAQQRVCAAIMELSQPEKDGLALTGFMAVMVALEDGRPVFAGATARYIGEQMVAAGRGLMRQC